MKILACGDIHTRTDLIDKALQAAEWDYFVFLGDACDDWGATQMSNIKTVAHLIDLKKEYGDKFIWIMGNHDWYYLDTSKRISGHIKEQEGEVKKLLEYNLKDIELMWTSGRYIFTHAGLSRDFIPFTTGIPLRDMRDKLRGDENPLNMVTDASGGSDCVSSMIWSRPEDTEPLPTLLGNIQVVGHTPVKTVQYQNRIFYCDTMSRNPYGNFIGDRGVLLLDINEEKDTACTIDIDTKKILQTTELPHE